MNKKILLILLAILLLAGGVFILLPSDEKKIRHNLDTLAEHCTTTKEEVAIELLKKAALAAKLCSDPCWVEAHSFHIARTFNRKDISDHILMMKKMRPDTRFTFHDTAVEFPGEVEALVTTTLRLQGGKGDTRFTDAYEIDITVKKSDNDWFFSSFSVVEFLEQ